MEKKNLLEEDPQTPVDIEEPGFLNFLKQKEQGRDLTLLSVFYLLLYFIVHYCYPYPLSTSDTGNYIFCAQTGIYGGFRPIGYSWFLDLFHSISTSYSFISKAQFLMTAGATLFFLFTVKFFFPPKNKIFFYSFALALILSPVTLYLTHWAMSDSVFASLTLLWLTSGIWLMQRKSWGIAVFHFLVMFLAIEVRFAGLFYPLITSIMLLYIHRTKSSLLAAISIIIPIVIYNDVKTTTRQLFKVDTFSGFSGWAQANNVVAILPYIELDPQSIRDAETRITHRIISQFPDSVFKKERIIATSFMWNKDFSGKEVLYFLMDQNPESDYVQAWIYTGTLLEKYSKFLIAEYPWQYFKHFILMNTWQTFHPETTLLSYEARPVDDVTKAWYNDVEGVEKTEARFDLIGSYIAPLLGWACSTLWLVIVFSVVYGFIKRNEIPYNNMQKNILLYFFVFTILYLGFSIAAHPVHLRYLMPLHALQISFIYFIFNGIKPRQELTDNT